MTKKDRAVKRAFDTLDEIEGMGKKRKVKIELLTKRKKNGALRNLFVMAMDGNATYGYAPPAASGMCTDTMEGGPYDRYKKFRKLLKQLESRELTGNKAKKTVAKFLRRLSKQEEKWYRRILRRDLRIGIAFKTFDAVWPGVLQRYTVQLALEYPDHVPPFPCVGEPKYDGIRFICEVENGVAVMRSRNGKEYPGLQFLADRLASVTDNVALDAEIMSKTWNETQTLIRTAPENLTAEQKKKLNHIKLFCFDLVPIDGFRRGGHPHKDSRRRKALKGLIRKLRNAGHSKNFKLVPRYPIDDQSDIEDLIVNLLEQGFEGLMIKDPNAAYEPAKHRDFRCPHWLKYKPWEDFEGTIIGLEEGKKGKKNEGRLGAFVVELANGDVIKVGGSLSDKDRVRFWEMGADALVGETLEGKRQKDAGDNVAASRFPQYARIRNAEDE